MVCSVESELESDSFFKKFNTDDFKRTIRFGLFFLTNKLIRFLERKKNYQIYKSMLELINIRTFLKNNFHILILN